MCIEDRLSEVHMLHKSLHSKKCGRLSQTIVHISTLQRTAFAGMGNLFKLNIYINDERSALKTPYNY